jgi:hypothetical protein
MPLNKMPLNYKHRLLISPELGSIYLNFDLDRRAAVPGSFRGAQAEL